MMFLLKAAFWVGLVLIILPTGSKTSAPEVNPADAASAASATVSDLSNFCTRQPNACSTGAQIAAALGERAQAGAAMVYAFLTERSGPAQEAFGRTLHHVAETTAAGRPDTTGSVAGTPATPAVLLPRPHPLRGQEPPSQDTLTMSDRQAAWRGPALRQEARLRPAH